jgi:HSP20 family molecular chaperone IbpA
MTLTLDCGARLETACGPAIEEDGCDRDGGPVSGSEASTGGLTTVRVMEGEGQFLLTAAVSREEQDHITVDMAPHNLRLRSGRTNRWVPLPSDALVNEAVVQMTDGLLTVAIPVPERRKLRHVVHVW